MKLPKNFRQIGDISGLTKIYMEDYVMTYLSAITKDSMTYVRGAILFGTMEQAGSEYYIYVNGAMAAQNIELDLDETVFDDAVWKKIYDTKEQYFPKLQVVGWYLCRTGMSVRLNDKIKKTHFENFPGDGKILYVRDPLDEEEAMYAYRGQDLQRQNGYYVYYVKNKEMQDYMVEQKSEQEAAISYERMMERRRDEKIIRQSRKKLKRKNTSVIHFVQKTAVAAVFMFCLGAAGTYLIFGHAGLPQAAVSALSSRVKNIYPYENSSEESVSAVFTAASEEQIQSAATENSENAQQSISTERTYTVQKGDTISKISRRLFQTKEYVDAIMEENGLTESDSIYPGQKLKIPSVKVQ